MSDNKKKKKEKAKYVDDGRTIADMSAFRKNSGFKTDDKNFVRPPSTAKDKWNTYWAAVRSMLVPMFITLGVITLLFFLAFVFLGGFNYYFQ